MKYVIEHFGKAFKWHLIEYEHISKLVGKDNLIFTNTSSKPLASFGKVEKKALPSLAFLTSAS